MMNCDINLVPFFYCFSLRNTDMSYLWRVPHALDDGALRALLGDLAAPTPVDEAMRAALAELGFGTPSPCGDG